MPGNVNTDILRNLRDLLLLWPAVTDVVDMRIRPDGFHSADGSEPALMLEVIEANEQNFIDERDSAIDARVMITCRARTPELTHAAAEGIRTQNTDPGTGLDGYRGYCGLGHLRQSNRTDFSTGKLYDNDGNETDFFESRQVYRLLYVLQN